MLVCNLVAYALDEYYHLGESTRMEAMKCFVQTNITCFQSKYLKQPTQVDLLKQLKINDEHDFLRMFGSIDYMHYRWKKCLVANKVMFKVKLATITQFLKPLLIKVHGFDTFFSSCMNATMMCMCLIACH